MRVALWQMLATAEKDENLATIERGITEAAAAGAALVAFPECAMLSVDGDESWAPLAEPLEGPFVSALRAAARASGIAVIAGVVESIPGSEKTHNTAVAISAQGTLIGVYRKIHMFDAFGYRESDRNQPGSGETLVFELEDMTVGVAICYDVRFPELYRRLAEQGAQLIVQPTSWAHGLLKEHHWNALVTARAIENTVYMAAPDQLRSAGTMVVDPMGVAIARRGDTPGLIVAEVTPERVAEVRRTVPSLSHVRPDLYDQWRRVPQPV